MNCREILQRMNPLGVFDHWSMEEIRSTLIYALIHGRKFAPKQSPYWRN